MYPYRITYDIECLLSREQLPEGTDKVTYTNRHELLSVSICSNVPGYDTPVCLIRSGTVQELVNDFVDRLETIACRVEDLLSERLDGVLHSLRVLVRQREEVERMCQARGSKEGRAAVRTTAVRRVLHRLLQWIRAVPVVGFNSQRYDLNVLKSPLMRRLVRVDAVVDGGGGGDDDGDDDGDDATTRFELDSGNCDNSEAGDDDDDGDDGDGALRFVVKRSNALTVVETRRLRFLDITNFIAPGFSYERYLKAYGCELTKGYFPYEWMDSLEKLRCTSLPPQEVFYSRLKGTGLTDEEYALCRQVWRANNMRTFADFLAWYNNLDVEPMLQAI